VSVSVWYGGKHEGVHLVCDACGATPVRGREGDLDTAVVGYLPGTDCPACDDGELEACGNCSGESDDELLDDDE
jgi:hypothetical protein